MKKLIVILVAAAAMLLSAFNASAQDIILTRDSQIITAVVTEISDAEIVYKSYDNQAGPNYRIATDRVQKIRFANGTEQVFAVPINTVEVPQYDRTYSAPVRYHMEQLHGDFELNGKEIPREEYCNYFNADEFETVNSALRQRKAGKGLLIAGGVTMGVASFIELPWFICLVEGGIAGGVDESFYKISRSLYIAGCAMDAAGLTLMTVGAPLFCIGKARLNWAADSYNQRNAMSFNVVSGRNGLGLALKF